LVFGDKFTSDEGLKIKAAMPKVLKTNKRRASEKFIAVSKEEFP